MRKQFGTLVVTDGVDLDVGPGEVHALIGPNGAGKTTLINLISGFLAPDAGHIEFVGADITAMPIYRRAQLGLARSFQIAAVFPGLTVLENVSLAAQAFCSQRDCELRARAALDQASLAHRSGSLAGNLSHGERRILELAITLAGQPKLLLLDEPLAGTGQEEAQRIVALLRSLKGKIPMVLVEHDMDAVFTLADRITVLLYGRVLATGAAASVRDDPRVIAAYLGDDLE